MDSPISTGRPLRPQRNLALLALAGLLAALGAGLLASGAEGRQRAVGATATQTLPAGGGIAVLEECVSTGAQADRAATFSGEMSAVAGTVRMAIRIDVEERAPSDAEFHTVTAPGLGVWRPSDPRVKVYKYLKQVTNLSMPAAYRGYVRFRWIGAKGHVIKRADRLTAKCVQPAPETEPAEPPPASPTTSTSASGSSPPPTG
jgi:hypothetical protein